MRHRSKLAKKYRSKKRSSEPVPKRKGRHKRRAIAKRNPSSSTWLSGFPAVDWVETGKLVGVGFAGFAAGRLATRIVAVQVAKRKPTWGKHAGVLANAATFAAALFLAKKWSKTRPYEMPLILGTGLSLLQTFVQTYFPKLGWIVSDATADDIAQASGQNQQLQPATTGYLPDDDGDVDDEESWSNYNDAYDQGRHATSAQPGNQPPPPAPQPRPVPTNGSGVHEEGGGVDHDEVDEMLSELDDTSAYAN